MRNPWSLSRPWLVGLSSACLIVTLDAVPVGASTSETPAVEPLAAVSSFLDDRGKALDNLRRVAVRTSQARFDEGVDNQGWWSNKERNGDDNDNYLVGECPDCESAARFRNFFTFKLPRVDGKVVAARLVVRRYRATGNVTETLDLYNVRAAARQVNRNRGVDPEIYRDLGSGTKYGRFRVATKGVDPNSLVGFWLNRAALADINAARGRYFTIGGRLASASRTDKHFDSLFGFSELRGPALQELRLFIERPPA